MSVNRGVNFEHGMYLWAQHAQAMRYAQARFVLYGRRQFVHRVRVEGQTWWHVRSRPLSAVAAMQELTQRLGAL